MRRYGGIVLVAALLTAAVPALAAPAPAPYENAGREYRNVLPPGQNGHVNALELGAFLAGGARPPHSDDQMSLYSDLVGAAPGLDKRDLVRYFKDASFGIPPGEVGRTYRPRSDVVIQRDRRFGVPHITGDGRDGAMFGAGYIAAEDRLFFIDVLRHVGRAQLSSFAGGAPGNRAMDQAQWLATPYAESELQRQFDLADEVYGARGRQLQRDARNYVAGINAYIAEAKLNPLKMPGEYAAILRPQGPDPWKTTDIIATAALVAGIFGKGGGSELGSALVLDDARARFGKRRGTAVWEDFRSAEDPEAPVTVHRDEGRFPYQDPKGTDPRSRALPDRGSVRRHEIVASSSGAASSAKAGSSAFAPGIDIAAELEGLLAFPAGNSNALLVSRKESRSGHPLAVFGPQVAYFNPQILVEQSMVAPKGPGGPAIAARGAAFPGTNLYVQLGRGKGYSWSATSAGQDIIDTYAAKLCEPGGGRPTLESMGYDFHGRCLPIEVLERRNSWSPTPADGTPSGSQTLRAERTRWGIVQARAEVDGRPVVYTSLRTTYNHEVDSALGFSQFNEPASINRARDFQKAAGEIDYTFNWFYIDDRDIAYFNSGDNPVRGKGADPSLPVHADRRWEWRDWNPTLNLRKRSDPFRQRQAPFREHPQVVNQRYLTSWNNKQARGYRASDANFGFSSHYRSEPLDDRIQRGIAGRRKMGLHDLADAMEDAATVDLRADKVLPLALRVLGDQRGKRGRAVRELRRWTRDGAHRRDENGDGVYEHRSAVALLDAWWPRWMQSQFKPELRGALYERLRSMIGLDNAPNNHGAHLGSAYQDGWYGYASKDLRTLLGRPVRGEYSRVYCGGGKLRRCRGALERSLDVAIKQAANPAKLYADDQCAGVGQSGTPECFDSIFFRPLGAVTQPNIPWQNRPTFQQVIEITK